MNENLKKIKEKFDIFGEDWFSDYLAFGQVLREIGDKEATSIMNTLVEKYKEQFLIVSDTMKKGS